MKQLICLTLTLLLIACASKTPEEQATEAALNYYQSLLDGKADGLQAAKVTDDSICAEYQGQLGKVYQHYIDDMQRLHQGLKAVRISDNQARRDSIQQKDGHWEQVIYAFLILSFNDSTEEQISVPMVQRQEEWYIK